MKQITPKKAGIISVVLAIVLLLAIYICLGTVDIVFMKDGKESATQDDVTVFSDIHFPEGESFIQADGEEVAVADEMALRVEIGKTLLMNFISFNWAEENYVITNVNK